MMWLAGAARVQSQLKVKGQRDHQALKLIYKPLPELACREASSREQQAPSHMRGTPAACAASTRQRGEDCRVRSVNCTNSQSQARVRQATLPV